MREIQSQHSLGGRQEVLYDIFQTWLMEDEQATWEKLVAHLHAAACTRLADAIQSRLRKCFSFWMLVEDPKIYLS